jgi:hypothetical protein
MNLPLSSAEEARTSQDNSLISIPEKTPNHGVVLRSLPHDELRP